MMLPALLIEPVSSGKRRHFAEILKKCSILGNWTRPLNPGDGPLSADEAPLEVEIRFLAGEKRIRQAVRRTTVGRKASSHEAGYDIQPETGHLVLLYP